MPTNKKEGFIFGVMMCFGMVCVMSIYNAIINGAIHQDCHLSGGSIFMTHYLENIPMHPKNPFSPARLVDH